MDANFKGRPATSFCVVLCVDSVFTALVFSSSTCRGEETYELDEDDYDLLQEANVTGFHRPPKAVCCVLCGKNLDWLARVV